MPTHIHKGIAIGEMTRVIRNTTSPALFNLFKRKLIKHFRHRGYPKRILKTLVTMKHENRQTMLLHNRRRANPTAERGLPLKLEYKKSQPTLAHILKRRWKITHNDFRLMTLFPNAPSPFFTNRIKLGAMLSRKRCSYNILPSSPELLPEMASNLVFLKFNHPKPLPRR